MARNLVRVTALILLMSLFFASCATKPTPVASATAIPSEPAPQASTEIPMITPTAALSTTAPSAANGQEPPPCTFPLAQITTTESAAENYTFSDPQVVLTAKPGNFYTIVQWLPDNQQILMTEVQYGVVQKIGSGPAEESINLFNPDTLQSKVYALRIEDLVPPAWNPALNAVVYPATHYTTWDYAHSIYVFTRQIWASYGDPNAVQQLADNLSKFPSAMKPDGSEIIYLSGNQLGGVDKSLKSIPSVFFDPDQWDYAKPRGNNVPEHYAMAWQPGTSLIFFYSDGISDEWRCYTFILNADTGHICELNLGGWADKARWSSNGRYLAIGVASTVHLADLALLDTLTGKLTMLAGAPQGINGQLFINDFIWAPDDYHLLAIGSVIIPQNSQGENNAQGLSLVDIESGQSVEIIFPDKFYTNSGPSMAWSPDGSKLVVRCPANLVDRLCFIAVQQSGQ